MHVVPGKRYLLVMSLGGLYHCRGFDKKTKKIKIAVRGSKSPTDDSDNINATQKSKSNVK